MSGSGDYTVGRVADLAGVTVRTLHHYDEIGLVTPSGRTAAGYRNYEVADVARLRTVLMYRRLGFDLDTIATLVNDPSVDPIDHLRKQRELLLERRDGIEAMVAAIDRQLEADAMGMQLSPEEQLEVFGTDKVGGEWAQEAEQRWGETDAFRESQRRAATYTKADWERIKVESDQGLRDFVTAMGNHLDPTCEQAMDLAEAHRRFISDWFYECTYEFHRGLAEMYIADERFTATYDAVAPGLAGYVRDAIIANADRHELS